MAASVLSEKIARCFSTGAKVMLLQLGCPVGEYASKKISSELFTGNVVSMTIRVSEMLGERR